MFERTVGLFFFSVTFKKPRCQDQAGKCFWATFGCTVRLFLNGFTRCWNSIQMLLSTYFAGCFLFASQTCRLETGDYQGAARDCTQALRMSDQAISSPLPMLDPIITYYNHQVAMVFCPLFPHTLVLRQICGFFEPLPNSALKISQGRWQTWMRLRSISMTNGGGPTMKFWRPGYPLWPVPLQGRK